MAVHVAVIAHASHVAQLAAQRGAQAAAAADGSVNVNTSAIGTATQTVTDLGGHLAQTPQILLLPRLTGMRVDLQIQGIVPFLPTHVQRTVWVSKEEFILEQDR